MRNLIRRTAHLLGLLLTPGTGTHRAGTRPTRRRPALHPHPHPIDQLPPHRSPYGLDLAPFDGGTSPLVRPYLGEVAA
ncbi:hypothetical protein [Streptomyces capitiformicae]|uniref:Uncharacterized protein n=1 Tax=Streptomyces capitiformicae TaxID=2014920 RepID=A0A918ZCD5_9ACTN|nr:hypothetical protein [Streptomyces capitiformicae]GHE45878.1 hypothetical protein GCM10017771_66490 [Streptomyces capitiformicae]